ncbi:MAG: glycerophosphodiester phosphodiesterase, partial [Polyangiaceae bacterium]|nr:glycerophosphodiester phosphodiesterase [Polyangiaceae bacterium]
MNAHRPCIVSHRGLGFGHRENGLAAFAAVRDDGRFGVELDARLTRDDIAVVCHDPEVELGDAMHASIEATEARDLITVVPTLSESLDALAGIFVDLEIKPTKRSIDPILHSIRGRLVRLSSFSAEVLES